MNKQACPCPSPHPGECPCSRVRELERQLTNQRENNHRRNVALDALHFVWCDGGCEGGTHRFDHGELTREIVIAAELNTQRLRRHWNNKVFRRIWNSRPMTFEECKAAFAVDPERVPEPTTELSATREKVRAK